MPHAPLVFKMRCHHPNRKRSIIANKNYLKYIATREGVDLSVEKNNYNINEDIIYKESENDKYIKYMANRPRSHGLFGNVDTSNLDKLAKQVADLTKQGKNIYRGIISLSGLDAEKLGYTSKEKWNTYLKKVMPDIAKEIGISVSSFTWVAAFHAEKSHPHVHFQLWDNTNKIKSPYIHTSIQHKCRKLLSDAMFDEEYENYIKEIYKLEREELNAIRNKSRSEITRTVKELMESMDNFVPGLNVEKLPSRITINEVDKFSKDIYELVNILPTKGSIDYKYLSENIKKHTDKIVDSLLDRLDIKKELHEYLKAVEDGHKLLGKSKFDIDIAKNNANKDIRKRVANIVLKHCKEIKISYNNAEQFITETIEKNGDPKESDYDTDFLDYESNEHSNLHIESNRYNLKWNDSYKKALFYLYNNENKDCAKAFEILQNETKKKNILALIELGKMYTHGLYTKKNDIIASRYYKEAFTGLMQISRGHTNGELMYHIGNMYYNGLGTDKNEDKAIEYLETAANLNNRNAQYLLSKIYLQKEDSQKNDIAITLLQNLANSNHKMAQYTLGKLYLDAKYRNKDRAIELLEKASEQGNSFINYQLGKLYYKGSVIDYDITKAIKYFEIAAKQNNSFAQYQLGKIYIWGNGVEPNETQGLYWLNKAIEQGNTYAEKTLEMYDNYKKNAVINMTYNMIKTVFNMIGNEKYNTVSSNNEKVYRSKSKQARKEEALRNRIPGNTAELEEEG